MFQPRCQPNDRIFFDVKYITGWLMKTRPATGATCADGQTVLMVCTTAGHTGSGVTRCPILVTTTMRTDPLRCEILCRFCLFQVASVMVCRRCVTASTGCAHRSVTKRLIFNVSLLRSVQRVRELVFWYSSSLRRVSARHASVGPMVHSQTTWPYRHRAAERA